MVQLFVIRTAIGREAQVVDFLASNIKKIKSEIFSVFFPHGMSGYILVEADELAAVRQASYGVPYVRGVLGKPANYAEVTPMIEFKPEEININKGDTVSIIAGPFKGEKARVTRIDLQKAQIVLELLETAVPIPITLGLDSVKVIGKKDEKQETGD